MKRSNGSCRWFFYFDFLYIYPFSAISPLFISRVVRYTPSSQRRPDEKNGTNIVPIHSEHLLIVSKSSDFRTLGEVFLYDFCSSGGKMVGFAEFLRPKSVNLFRNC